MTSHQFFLLTVILFFANSRGWSQTDCNGYNPDVDDDNAITVTDLLALLGLFEEVDADNDGVWDSVDDCVGALDACGVCNGPGPAVLVEGSLVCPVYGCTDSLASNFSASANIDDGTCTYGLAQCGGASTVTFDGYTYALVGIGSQCWFKENLRSDNYLNGDAIPGSLTNQEWSNSTSGAQSVYGEDSWNLQQYGRLYNYYAVSDSRGLCPSGWHVPSDEDWKTLELALGMSMAEVNQSGHRGNGQGTFMKVGFGDSPPWDGTNSSGFTGLPGGDRSPSGGHNYMGNYGFWWTSSGLGRELTRHQVGVRRDGWGYGHGFSVRCVVDGSSVGCWDPDNDGVCAENEVTGCVISTALNYNPLATNADNSCEFSSSACLDSDAITFDGYTYALVGIGSQCWFKENLRSDNYLNGDAIPGSLTNQEWSNSTSGAQSVYGEDSWNLQQYGRLYNYYAVSDSRGLCPSGWHVPSDEDWKTLELALGMSMAEVNQSGHRGNGQGTFMKVGFGDSPPWDGTNSSGFTGLPGGDRSPSGGHNYMGNYGFWWTSSGLGRELTRHQVGVRRDGWGYGHGFSVRCVQN